ncbi:unnamed protein product [Rotaria magnacalcarata]|uniref:Mannosyl-oligosaccharide glucosidase n=5 Tax=Rotaria magnacalcarata TaxID=392030 RepID=A0A816ZGC8_9BILA|nr:unnamed protein product [Rotaria magnacalcarata]
MDNEMLITNQPIVIDNGSGVIKAGFAGDPTPKINFPNYVGRPKHVRVMAGGLEGDTFIGPKAEEYRGLLHIAHPMEHGIVEDWNDMEKIWSYIYSKHQLRSASEEHPVLLTEAPLNPRKNREKAAEIFFETFNVPALYISMQAVLSLYASGRTTGVVLDSGDGVTHAVPIYEGFAMPHSILRNDVAGRDVTRYLKLLLRKEGYSFKTTAEFEIVKSIKERACFLTTTTQKEEINQADKSKFTLPDGTSIDLGSSRHLAPEVLFNPELIGDECEGMHEILSGSIRRSDMDVRRILYQNIVLSGGSTLFRGFGDRLLSELKRIAPKEVKIKISAPRERLYSTWIGGSILASLDTFKKIWVTKREYDAEGARMTDKLTQRHRKNDTKHTSNLNNDQINEKIVAATKKRKSTRNNASPKESFLLKIKSPTRLSIFLITSLVVLFYLCKMLIGFVSIEHTNVPIDLPKLININEATPDRFWGTYRSNLYFGLKHQSSKSLSGGLMWFDYGTLQRSNDRFLRHWCDQNDQLKYGWTYHDGESFGIEDIKDNNLDLNIQWMKQLSGQHGGDWTTRINVTPKPVGSTIPISLFFYFHHEHPWLKEVKSISKQSPDTVIIHGQTNELDKFSIKIHLNTLSQQPVVRTLTDVFRLDTIHRDILTKLTSNSPKQPFFILADQTLKDSEPNTFFIQITLRQPVADEVFSFDIIYQSESSAREREQDLTGLYFNEELVRLQKQFDQRFETIFQLKTKQKMDETKINFARSTLSNLIGGISYFTGQSLVAKPGQQTPDQYFTTSLYTAVPSRSFFPRGFLWDEGFHNLLIARWNQNITIDILKHWFDMLNDNGWIPREIILGDEARARVPSEFVIQHTNNANPPTFFLTIDYLLKTNQANHLFTLPFIQRLEKWYQWYNRTQVGPTPFTFRWRGRNASSIYELNPKTLTSGLDDYPRASHPTDSERHLDLRCWMTLASGIIGKLYSVLNNEKTNEYLAHAQLLSNNDLLDQLHWSDEYEMYADYGLHTDYVQLERVPIPKKSPSQQYQQTHIIRQVTKDSDVNFKYVKHFGYVSLFPLMTRVLNPHSNKLDKILNDLKNSTLLWTPYGLRSLARSSSLYGMRNTEHDPPYWRGAIWINMNYMVLSALQHYAKMSGPYSDKAQDIYKQLRANLLKNMLRVYEKTGHIWEQYDDKTGNGKGSHPFTGWSSLIVLIMSELYDE